MTFQSGIESEIIAIALGYSPRPPVDLLQVAASIGADDTRATHFRDGFTDFNWARPAIYLNGTETGPRMRFIWAHELAHVILRMRVTRSVLQSYRSEDLLHDEENLADRIAATLLVPDNWVENLRLAQLTLTRLEYIARAAGVTVLTLVVRMANAGIDVGMLQWWRGFDSWHVVDRPGVPPSLHGHVELSEIGRRFIENVGLEETGVTVDACVNGENVKIRGIGSRRDRLFVQLLRPSRDIIWFTTAREPSSTITDARLQFGFPSRVAPTSPLREARKLPRP